MARGDPIPTHHVRDAVLAVCASLVLVVFVLGVGLVLAWLLLRMVSVI